MKIEKGTLGQRKRALIEFVDGLCGADVLQYVAGRFGKDALMYAALEAAELDKRPMTEKLAEIAFDLVPGQVQREYKVTTRTITIPRIPDIDPLWNTKMEESPHFEQCVLEPRRWHARACFAFDEESGILAVREV